MADINTDRNIPVKTFGSKYSYAQVASSVGWAQNRCMKNLKTLRKRRNLSQADLAEMVNVTQSFISKIEKGQGNPSLDVMEALARALGVTPVALFELPEFHARIISAIDALPESRKEVALRAVEAMAGSLEDS